MNGKDEFASSVNALNEITRLLIIESKYNELIYAVGNKYPNETRHQTALRYIQQAEKSESEQQSSIKTSPWVEPKHNSLEWQATEL